MSDYMEMGFLLKLNTTSNHQLAILVWILMKVSIITRSISNALKCQFVLDRYNRGHYPYEDHTGDCDDGFVLMRMEGIQCGNGIVRKFHYEIIHFK